MSTPRRLTAAPTGSKVVLSEDALLLTGLRIDDPDVLAAAHRAHTAGTDLDGWVPALLRTGAVALAAASNGRDLAELDAAVRRASDTLQRTVQLSSERLTAVVNDAVHPEHGPLAAATRAQVDRLAAGVQRLVSGSDALLPASVRASVAELTRQAMDEIVRSLATATTTVQQTVAQDRHELASTLQGLLVTQHTQVSSQLGDLRAQLAASQTNRVRTSSIRGASWETTVVDQISRIAAGAGDGAANATGSTTGLDGGKSGDAVVDLLVHPGGSPVGRLVVEAKDLTGTLSLAKLQQEVRSGRACRAAEVALVVVPRADMLPGQQSFLAIDDRAFAVAWEPGLNDLVLSAVYLLLKHTCVRDHHGRSNELEAVELTRRSAAALSHLTEFDRLDRHAGTASKSLEALREVANKLRQQLTTELEAISGALTAA